MAEEKEKEGRNAPMGPFAPPLPKNAESDEKEPMAVSRDKDSYHQSFLPTSAPLDQFNEDVARKIDPHMTKEAVLPKSQKETRAAQDPDGYTKTDKRGFQHLDEDDVDEKY